LSLEGLQRILFDVKLEFPDRSDSVEKRLERCKLVLSWVLWLNNLWVVA